MCALCECSGSLPFVSLPLIINHDILPMHTIMKADRRAGSQVGTSPQVAAARSPVSLFNCLGPHTTTITRGLFHSPKDLFLQSAIARKMEGVEINPPPPAYPCDFTLCRPGPGSLSKSPRHKVWVRLRQARRGRGGRAGDGSGGGQDVYCDKNRAWQAVQSVVWNTSATMRFVLALAVVVITGVGWMLRRGAWSVSLEGSAKGSRRVVACLTLRRQEGWGRGRAVDGQTWGDATPPASGRAGEGEGERRTSDVIPYQGGLCNASCAQMGDVGTDTENPKEHGGGASMSAVV